jgi:hypothetical protein
MKSFSYYGAIFLSVFHQRKAATGLFAVSNAITLRKNLSRKCTGFCDTAGKAASGPKLNTARVNLWLTQALGL